VEGGITTTAKTSHAGHLFGGERLERYSCWVCLYVIEFKFRRDNSRKKIVEKEIAGLGRSLIEVKGLERKKRDLISKNRVLQNVQSSRSEIVRLFDESVNAVPMGVTLTTLERKDDLISISGVARSNHDVAALMKNLDESYLLTRAKLKEIGVSGSGVGVGNIFYMEVELDVVRD
jgi:type IV pilus assembly protein PilN